jgi:arsenate reductase
MEFSNVRPAAAGSNCQKFMSEETIMYFNPSCSKCLYAFEFLQSKGITPKLIHYLEQHPTAAELKKISEGLGLRPFDLVRTSEPLFAEKFEGKDLSDDEWLKALEEYPVLLQRPILVKNNKAAIGRSPEQLDGFLL